MKCKNCKKEIKNVPLNTGPFTCRECFNSSFDTSVEGNTRLNHYDNYRDIRLSTNNVKVTMKI